MSLSPGCSSEGVALPIHLLDEQVRSDIRPKRGRKKRKGRSLSNPVESVVVESGVT